MLPSADTIVRVFSRIILAHIRSLTPHVYSRLKRNKAIKKTMGFYPLLLDGKKRIHRERSVLSLGNRVFHGTF